MFFMDLITNVFLSPVEKLSSVASKHERDAIIPDRACAVCP